MTDFLAAAKLHFQWAHTAGYIKSNGRIQNQSYSFQPAYGQGEANLTEGQSYAMMESVLMDDYKTFDLVWQWTKANMQLNATALAASRRGGGTALDTYVTNSGQRAFTDLGRSTLFLMGWIYRDNWNTLAAPMGPGLAEISNATDGDFFIATALLLAWERWQNPQYKTDALNIIGDLFLFNMRPGGSHLYMNFGSYSGNDGNPYACDPSYLCPWMMYMFANYDTAHAAQWIDAADQIYNVFPAAMNTNFWHMPPYQVGVNRGTGAFSSYGPDENFDAFRCWPNLMMDNDPRGIAIMNDKTRGKWNYYVQNGKVPEQMLNNGSVTFNGGNPNYSPWGCCEIFSQMYALNSPITVSGVTYPNYDAWYQSLPSNIRQQAAGWWWDSSDYYANWPWFLACYAIGSDFKIEHNFRRWLIFNAGTLAANKASFDTLNSAIMAANGLASYATYYIFSDNIQVAIPIWGNAKASLTVPQKQALVGELPAGVWTAS